MKYDKRVYFDVSISNPFTLECTNELTDLNLSIKNYPLY